MRTVGAVDLGPGGALVGSEDAAHEHRFAFDDGDVFADLPAGGGDLGADEPAADDQHVVGAFEVGAQAGQVGGFTEHVDPGQPCRNAGQIGSAPVAMNRPSKAIVVLSSSASCLIGRVQLPCSAAESQLE
ncbi:hypothetical protein PV419_52180 [Streptomyces sp. ME19-01-6]|nr:hypothetical protein [Streptomyces sp. ME19-01-6]MDX3233924.1 hypothetical protein [Streptomyces sp. ME19-01-6]